MISILHEQILKAYQRIQLEIHNLQEQINNLPEGKLICAHGKNCFKWFISDGHKKEYLPKKERVLAEKLAAKKYLLLKLEELTIQKEAIESYLSHDLSKLGQADRLLIQHLGFQNLLKSHFQPISQELSEWMNSPYEKNKTYPEYLIHKTNAGIHVRSKAEAMIVQILYSNQIPFRYECALYLGNTVFYPDFTIRHPITGETYYWEHFGKMDDESYVRKTYSKLQLSFEEVQKTVIHFLSRIMKKIHLISEK